MAVWLTLQPSQGFLKCILSEGPPDPSYTHTHTHSLLPFLFFHITCQYPTYFVNIGYSLDFGACLFPLEYKPYGGLEYSLIGLIFSICSPNSQNSAWYMVVPQHTNTCWTKERTNARRKAFMSHVRTEYILQDCLRKVITSEGSGGKGGMVIIWEEKDLFRNLAYTLTQTAFFYYVFPIIWFFKIKFIFFRVQLIYSVESLAAVQYSDPLLACFEASQIRI